MDRKRIACEDKPTKKGWHCPRGEAELVERRVDELVRQAAARMLLENQ
jgi:hypothetical protein